MTELTPRERLQPSLLDRLTDYSPHQRVESREQRVLSLEKLRECVLRDLEWLLNTGKLDQTEDLSAYPHVSSSVLNYGVIDLAGRTLSTADIPQIEQAIRKAIWDFEPRILRQTVQVRATADDSSMTSNALTFEIEGALWAQPTPLRVFLKTEIDLETGHVNIQEHLGR